jgi:putative membrane protein
MGWFLCVFTIYLIFAFYLKKNGEFKTHPIVSEKLYWIQAAIVYSQLTLFVLFRALFEESSIVTTLDNHQWWTGDLYETASLMWVFTMFFVASLAIIKTIRNEKLDGIAK